MGRSKRAGGKVIMACEMRCDGEIDEETKDERVVQAAEMIAEAVKDYRSKEEKAREEKWKGKITELERVIEELKKEKKRTLTERAIERDDTMEILENSKLWENRCRRLEQMLGKSGKDPKPRLILTPAKGHLREAVGKGKKGKQKGKGEKGKSKGGTTVGGKSNKTQKKREVILLSDSDENIEMAQSAVSEGDLCLNKRGNKKEPEKNSSNQKRAKRAPSVTSAKKVR